MSRRALSWRALWRVIAVTTAIVLLVGPGLLPGSLPGSLRGSRLGTLPALNGIALADTQARWGQRAALPASNSEIGVAQVGDHIFVIGGYPASRAVQATVQAYDVAQDRWELIPPLPRPSHHVMAAGVDGVLYVIGGETTSSTGGAEFFTNAVYAYDPGARTWSVRAPMLTARSGGAVAIVDGKIYVAGGRPPRGHDFAVYDPAADAWTVLPDLPTQRNHLAATAIGGKVYVAGGRFGGGVGSEMTAALEVFDPATLTWEPRAPLLAPRAGLNGIAANGCFYTFGGEGNDADPRGVFSNVELYDPTADTWRSLEPLPIAIHGVTGAALAGEWIHLPGGGTARGGSSGSTLHQVFHVEETCG